MIFDVSEVVIKNHDYFRGLEVHESSKMMDSEVIDIIKKEMKTLRTSNVKIIEKRFLDQDVLLVKYYSI